MKKKKNFNDLQKVIVKEQLGAENPLVIKVDLTKDHGAIKNPKLIGVKKK